MHGTEQSRTTCLGCPLVCRTCPCSFCRQNPPKVRQRQQLNHSGLTKTSGMLSDDHCSIWSDLQIDVMGAQLQAQWMWPTAGLKAHGWGCGLPFLEKCLYQQEPWAHRACVESPHLGVPLAQCTAMQLPGPMGHQPSAATPLSCCGSWSLLGSSWSMLNTRGLKYFALLPFLDGSWG